MKYTMQPIRTICTYDIYNGLVRPFPLLEDMLKDPTSKIGSRVSGLDGGTKDADLKLLAFLEELLSNPPSTDLLGAQRVINAAKDQLIGLASLADHADLPLIMRYCKVHQDVIPLTCLALLSYGHTKEWTHIAVSQYAHPLLRGLVQRLAPSPMVARAVVEFTVADYALNDWLPNQAMRALPKLGFANDVLRKAEACVSESLSDARDQLATFVSAFVKKSGPMSSGLMELSASALNKLPLPDGALVNGKEIEDAGLTLGLLEDHAGIVWPFPNKITPADLFGLCGEYFDQNQQSRESLPMIPRAFDDSHACTWMLKAISGEQSDLSKRFFTTSKNDESRTASLLSAFMSKVDTHVSDDGLRQAARLNLTVGLAEWIGARNLSETNIQLAQQNDILREVFRAEQLAQIDPMLSAYGRKVITSFVMVEHRSLARHLSRADRGRHLEDEIGL